MAGFVKLYGSLLLGSSLMDQSIEARWLFMVLLSAADEHGFVRCQTVGNAARLANLTYDQARSALDELSSPDPKSTTPDHEGRRIIPAPGGWSVVNYSKYREMRTERQAKDAGRQRRHRENQRRDMSRLSRQVSASASVYVNTEGVQGKPNPELQPSVTFPPARQNELDEAAACEATCREYMALSGKPLDEILWEFSEFRGRRLVRLDTASLNWIKVTHDKIRAALIEARKAQQQPRGEGPLAKIRRIEAERDARLKGQTT